MRWVLWATVAALIVWIAIGAPVPVRVLKPLSPDPDLPTFGEAIRDRQAVVAAVEAGSLREDPELNRLRRSVLDAADRLRVFPCNKQGRKELSQALANLFSAPEDMLERETAEVEGRRLSASSYFSEEPNRIFMEAVSADVLAPAMFEGDIRRQIETFYGLESDPEWEKFSEFYCEAG